jgi:hypothetical protein
MLTEELCVALVAHRLFFSLFERKKTRRQSIGGQALLSFFPALHHAWQLGLPASLSVLHYWVPQLRESQAHNDICISSPDLPKKSMP